jgi:diacylglycerol kinase (ATP)
VVRKLAVLVNPASGRGGAARSATAAVGRLEDAGFEVSRLQGADAAESRSLAHRAVEDGVEALVVVGGDGLVHLAINVLAHTDVALGIIPAGTGNDAARTLGIPLADPRAAADLVVAGAVRTVDLGRAGAAYFFCVLSAGFDAVVNERADAMRWPRGNARYALATLAELRTLRALTYDLDLDGSRHSVEAVLVAVGNGPSFGGGLRVSEGAALDDGLLDVVVFHPVSRADVVRTYPRLYRGTHRRHPAYEHHRVREVRIAGPPVVVYADGERLGPLPVTVRAVPAALTVFTAALGPPP